MRQRVEDLGRLMVMLELCSDSEIFNTQNTYRRPKDACDWFSELTEDKKDDFIHCVAYQIDDLYSKICDMIEIAKGEDYINQDASKGF